MRTLSRLGAHRRPPRRAPVFADVSGRRRRRLRLIGIGAGAAMALCLVVMAVGLLGGPGASFIPWAGLGGHSSRTPMGIGFHGEAGTAPTLRAPHPSLPVPTPSPQTAASSSPAAGGASSPAASSSPTVTNRASKTPPGRNRTPSAHPSPSRA